MELHFPGATFSELERLLSGAEKIVITTHRKPDGDAMGSSLALQGVLEKSGFNVQIVSPTSVDDYLHWMGGVDRTINGWEHHEACETAIREADVLFCLDFSSWGRLESLETVARETDANIVLIDHHPGAEIEPAISFYRPAASSTAELIAEVIVGLGYEKLIDKTVATAIYTGIMTDTGSFRFSSTSSHVHRIAAMLLDIGVDIEAIHSSIYDNYLIRRNRFLGHILLNRMKVLEELNTSYMVISLEEMERFGIESGETEGFVNYNLSMKGIRLGVLIKEDHDKVKMSFRSKGDFPANELARHFDGGGHRNAAGGKSEVSLEETEKRFLTLLERYRSALSN